MKELDLLLSRFVRERYAAAAPERQRDFEEFLGLADPDIATWLLGQGPPPARWRDLVESILDPAPSPPTRTVR
jgi:succinate dehydrogenase flavin-adding protein (antitoxin of CptAB toxin-antitoxin module)